VINASFAIYGNSDLQLNYILAPQFDLTFSIDEIRITLILGFFLIGGNEAEDESDFLLADEGDLDVVEEIVAPLFIANLGKDIAENGALYLKVCSIFSFVLISNLRGRIPYGDTATSSLILTF
jgi:F0F1-type ATP synthase membrane subunit a